MKVTIPSSLTIIKQWFHNHLVQEIPSHLSICEFDCKETYCDYHIWQNCEKKQK
ncbi:hypothetical protein cce_1562 [Crocosphaera subtropica ATCC 51142]|uniref:Uncharacterized protein n=1 Tax=Crocosphaera subtropica (strain ATCC 51142 / BH68) TaxID=43989 RepID=B1WXS5_CROS5|nr:hypothetical protein cce_1562 [Crocosphaera subtropica ATCC 51142]